MTGRTILVIALVALAALMVYVRAAPSGPEWAVDPEKDGRTGDGRWLLADGGDAPALLLDGSPREVLDALARVASDDGAQVVAWDPENGMATFVHRSAVWGFPDYVSVKAASEAGRTRLSAYSRLRFGKKDFGVNRGRLERWMRRLQIAMA